MAVKITGSERVIAELMRYGKEVEQMVIDEVEDIATDIEIDATKNKGSELSFIKIDKIITNKGLTAKVGVQGSDPLAAYFEFGTGLSAKEILAPYPQEVKDVAMNFFKTGEGTLRGRPYLYPAYFAGSARFIRNLKIKLRQLRKG